MSLKIVESGLNWAVNGSLNVVLVQLELPDDAIWKADQSRPAAVATLKDLLDPAEGAKLSHLVPNAEPALVAFPELTFGSPDWAEIDALVRAHTSPLLLFGGFGACLGADLRTWQTTATPTEKIAAWDHAPEPGRRYPGGWCWIHEPGGVTRCITFLKTSLDARHEQVLPNWAKGTVNLAVKTADIFIFPAICSDWIDVDAGRYLLLEKIRGELARNNIGNRQMLMLALMSQGTVHGTWGGALHAASQVDMQRVNICVANSAYHSACYQEDNDRWRGYSGVYLARQMGRTPIGPEFNAIRNLPDNMLFGAILRSTDECVVSGKMRWDYPATARHAWAANSSFEIKANGKLASDVCQDTLEYEVRRFVKRIVSAEDRPPIAAQPYVADSLKSVASHLEANAHPAAVKLLQSVIYGIANEGGDWPQTDPDKIWDFRTDIETGFRIVGAAANEGGKWNEDVSPVGQVTFSDAAVLVWSSVERGSAVMQKFRRLRTEKFAERPLVVIAKGALVEEAIPTHSFRRDSIERQPSSASRAVDETRLENLVGHISLERFDACFDHGDKGACSEAVKSLLADGVQSLLNQGAKR